MPPGSVTYWAKSSRWETLPGRAWWIVFPPFAVLVGRLTYERACADPSRLLLALTSSPATAWPIALLYVVAHVWLFVVYVRVVARTNALCPSLADIFAIEGTEVVKILLMTLVLALEYSPLSLWRMIGASACIP
jgi:hypothetical protein